MNQLMYYLIAIDGQGREWRVFPDISEDERSWHYVVPDGYGTVAGRAVKPGDKISGEVR
jgi:hypothetical protein